MTAQKSEAVYISGVKFVERVSYDYQRQRAESNQTYYRRRIGGRKARTSSCLFSPHISSGPLFLVRF